MKHVPSSEAGSPLATQEIPTLLWNQKVFLRVQKYSSLDTAEQDESNPYHQNFFLYCAFKYYSIYV